MNPNTTRPRVSVLMANLNGAAHIAEAVSSVLRQTEASLELLLCDDGSSDDSLARAETAAGGDARLTIVRGGGRTGPSATRNRGLAVAQGEWIAVVDNDDLIEPDRLKRLCDAAEAEGADIAADNLLTFYEGSARQEHPHLTLAEPAWIDAAAYAESNIMLRGGRQLGYLKPIFRRTALGATRYDESLRIGEDSDLVLRLLIVGARMRIYPWCGYRYRKHAGSISHRLTPQRLDAILAAHARLDAGGDARLRRALARQGDALRDARAFEDLVAALKTRDLGGALAVALKRPAAVALLRRPILTRLKR
jgi:succinoglycan biosynthesis protein ExoO